MITHAGRNRTRNRLVRKSGPVIADAIDHRMREAGAGVHVTRHHISRPPVPRKHPRPDRPFCRIIHDGPPATIVHEWHDTLAIVPRSGGFTDVHLLVLPRESVQDFTTDPVVATTVQLRAAELAGQMGGQWNYLTSCGPDVPVEAPALALDCGATAPCCVSDRLR